MSCLPKDQIIDLVLDQLPEGEADAVLSHVAECETCRYAVNRYQDLSNHLAENMPKLTPQDLADIAEKRELSISVARQAVLANIREAVKPASEVERWQTSNEKEQNERPKVLPLVAATSDSGVKNRQEISPYNPIEIDGIDYRFIPSNKIMFISPMPPSDKKAIELDKRYQLRRNDKESRCAIIGFSQAEFELFNNDYCKNPFNYRVRLI